MIVVKKKKPVRRRRRRRSRIGPLQHMTAVNSYAALKDESYPLILRWVDEALKDPELRRKIDYHTRKILKAISEKF